MNKKSNDNSQPTKSIVFSAVETSKQSVESLSKISKPLPKNGTPNNKSK